MVVRRRIDATGRSAGPYAGREGRIYKPPAGEPWVWLTTALLASPAYRALSINARHVFDFLLIEQRAHAALENGRLLAPYDQLERFGVSRRLIRPALAELHAGGLVRCMRQGGMMGGERVAALYRLTMFAAEGQPATNEWRVRNAEAVKAAKRSHAEDARLRKAHRTARRKEAALDAQ